MLSKNKQGTWEVKIPSVCVFQGHLLLLRWVVYYMPVRCAVFAAPTKASLQWVYGLQVMQFFLQNKILDSKISKCAP